MRQRHIALTFVLAIGLFARSADAASPPSPYSLPWQLRPTAAVNVVRSDTTIASYRPPNAPERGTTVATTLLAGFKLTSEISPILRVAWVSNAPPGGPNGNAFVNPLAGVTWAKALPGDLKLAAFVGVTAPIGQGGGDTPDKATALARGSGILARSAMDNALFSVNDLTVLPGIGLAWVSSGWTVQAEATVLQLTRVRGKEAQPDASKTNFTAGLHVGYFVAKPLSIGAELRHQRWLSTPSFVAADPTGASRDTTTVAIGLRAHVPLGDSMWLRPGLAYARGLDDPMSASDYHIVQIDVPFTF